MHSLGRRLFIKILQLITFSNGYIAVCTVVMCQTTARLFRLQLPNPFLAFVFAGTLGSYSLHWYLTEPPVEIQPNTNNRMSWNQRHKSLLLILFIASALTGLFLLAYLKEYLIDLLPVVVLSFLYTAPKLNMRPFRALRRVAILKTAYLSLVWAYVTVALPTLISFHADLSRGQMIAYFLNRFLLIYCIAFWFDYRDRNEDRQSKWLTIVSMLSVRQSRFFFWTLVISFWITIVALSGLGLEIWPLLCLSLPMILLVLTMRLFESPVHDFAYYIYLDGLLMLSGLLLNI